MYCVCVHSRMWNTYKHTYGGGQQPSFKTLQNYSTQSKGTKDGYLNSLIQKVHIKLLNTWSNNFFYKSIKIIQLEQAVFHL